MPWQDQSRHFDRPLGGVDSRDIHARTDLRAAVAICLNNIEGDRANAERAFRLVGRGLHSIQDRYAHRNWDVGPLGIRIHPLWYDNWDDSRNAAARVSTENGTRSHLNSFISSVENTCCQAFLMENPPRDLVECCGN